MEEDRIPPAEVEAWGEAEEWGPAESAYAPPVISRFHTPEELLVLR